MKEESTDFTLAIIFIIFIAICFWIGDKCNNYSNKPSRVQNVTHLDTVVVLKAYIDTLEVERIKTKTIYEKQIDTIYMLDSVAIDSAYTKAIDKLRSLERTGFFKR